MKEYSFGNVVIRFTECREETYERLKKAAVEFEKNVNNEVKNDGVPVF